MSKVGIVDASITELTIYFSQNILKQQNLALINTFLSPLEDDESSIAMLTIIEYCFLYNNLDDCRLLLQSSVVQKVINEPYYGNTTLLYKLLDYGTHLDKVALLLDHSANPNIGHENGTTVLHKAIAVLYDNIVVEGGGYIPVGSIPEKLRIKFGKEQVRAYNEIVRKLIEKGAKIDYELKIAIVTGNSIALDIMLGLGAAPNKKTDIPQNITIRLDHENRQLTLVPITSGNSSIYFAYKYAFMEDFIIRMLFAGGKITLNDTRGESGGDDTEVRGGKSRVYFEAQDRKILSICEHWQKIHDYCNIRNEGITNANIYNILVGFFNRIQKRKLRHGKEIAGIFTYDRAVRLLVCICQVIDILQNNRQTGGMAVEELGITFTPVICSDDLTLIIQELFKDYPFEKAIRTAVREIDKRSASVSLAQLSAPAEGKEASVESLGAGGAAPVSSSPAGAGAGAGEGRSGGTSIIIARGSRSRSRRGQIWGLEYWFFKLIRAADSEIHTNRIISQARGNTIYRPIEWI